MSHRVRYMASTEPATPENHYAVVTTDTVTTERFAMRHARAMLDVQRAVDAWVRAERAFHAACRRDRSSSALGGQPSALVQDKAVAVGKARDRLRRAHAALKRIEKEVTRG